MSVEIWVEVVEEFGYSVWGRGRVMVMEDEEVLDEGGEDGEIVVVGVWVWVGDEGYGGVVGVKIWGGEKEG